MSSIINPVGPEQPRTYWRRRAAVVLALLVVVLLVWWLVRTAFGGESEPQAQPSASPSVGLSVPASPAASASPTTAASSAEPSASASAAACGKQDLVVVVTSEADTTDVGQGLALTMTVTNEGAQACRRDVGAGANEIRIESGSALVWSSDFCSPSTAKDRRVLAPGEQYSASVTWPGRVTAESCPAEQPLAQPGSYRAIARNLAVNSEPISFTVR